MSSLGIGGDHTWDKSCPWIQWGQMRIYGNFHPLTGFLPLLSRDVSRVAARAVNWAAASPSGGSLAARAESSKGSDGARRCSWFLRTQNLWLLNFLVCRVLSVPLTLL